MGIGSSKCDEEPYLKANMIALGHERLGALTVASSKCDWSITSNRIVSRVRGDEFDVSAEIRAGIVRFGGSKCDWNIRSPGLKVDGEADSVLDLRAGLPGGSIGVASSKCDWLVQAAPFHIQTQAGVRVRDFRGALSAGLVNVTSSKCDWSIQVQADPTNAQRPADVSTSVASSKCDFTLNIEFGLRGGPRYRLRAVGSDKCDFQVVDFEYLEDLRKSWESPPVGPSRKGE